MNFNIFNFFIALFLLSCNNTSNDSVANVEKIKSFKETQQEKVSDPYYLILHENSIANLAFENNESEISVQNLSDFFSKYNIQIAKDHGYDESGKIVYYTGWKGHSTFIIHLKEDQKSIKTFTIQTPSILDQYGVNIGMTYNQLVDLRNDLVLEKDPISMNPILRNKESNILYEFCCPVDLQVDYTIESLKDLKIQSIIWKSRF